MPRIFDNISSKLLSALQETLSVSHRSDFCVGYFNLRGWRHLVAHIEKWRGGEGNCCRLLVGMPFDTGNGMRQLLQSGTDDRIKDNQTLSREKRRAAEEFKEQLTRGTPANEDEAVLRQLARQIHDGKVCVRVFLCHPLHAKLYLAFRDDPHTPIVGYLGSSNLTLAGLSSQGELNVDVVDIDSANKLAQWFNDRWNERCCLDISADLTEIIDESWAGDRLVSPYHVYLKMAYHLSHEVRSGLSKLKIPSIFGDMLFDYQIAAVKLAARHLHKRNGVLIGDVVGLGKSLMATALAKIFEEDLGTETLILCPKNLVEMWQDYVHTYRLHAEVLSISKVTDEKLRELRRYRVVLIDESHNLRNPEGKRYKAIQSYIERNGSKCILLTATPYNKEYLDLSSQLGLFVSDDDDLGIRPEALIAQMGGEHSFVSQHQCSPRSIAAFRFSENQDDWRELMRQFMVRRTRGFIVRHYAKADKRGKYLEYSTGKKSYFPRRVPKTVTFAINGSDPDDSYARLYSESVVDTINSLFLPRYGLANYLRPGLRKTPGPELSSLVADLSKAGTRLMGFCRTNLFKRLESSGSAFLASVERHTLRNFVFLHAIDNDLEIPLGSQDSGLLDLRVTDGDADDDEPEKGELGPYKVASTKSVEEFRARAKQAYDRYTSHFGNRFKWIPSSIFTPRLSKELLADAVALCGLLNRFGEWRPDLDTKLERLAQLIQTKHRDEKVLVFTQFADTAQYLKTQLEFRAVSHLEIVTGGKENPTELAWRFSPQSNNKRDRIAAHDELRVLISTDVLSEGQNLQDCAIIINYDLPWAIIRLIQRVGRVDRIGQESTKILSYSFLPADGVERLIKLRARVRRRLQENAEVIGADETFFGEEEKQVMVDLYNEKSSILNDEDHEVDLASHAWQIWKDATNSNLDLKRKIETLPDVVYATKTCNGAKSRNSGVLVYTRTPQGNDILAWVDEDGNAISQSQQAILAAAACDPDTPALTRLESHHSLTQRAVAHIIEEEKTAGGSLGKSTGVRYKAYTRLKRYRARLDASRDLFASTDIPRIDQALEEIYRSPLHSHARHTLNSHIKSGISDEGLVDLVLQCREDGHLCVQSTEPDLPVPRIICSMGLR